MTDALTVDRTPETDRLADELHRARLIRTEVDTLTSRVPGLDLDRAYEVQNRGIELRREGGDAVVGGKLGFTSRAMQRAMGVDSPNYGWLTGSMLVHDHMVHLEELIHPKVEPEIGFLLRADLPRDCTAADVLEATTAVFPCLEIVDSRFRDFRFEILDNIADNSSAGLLVVGDAAVAPTDLDLARLGVVLSVDGDVVHTAAGAAALDDPAEAVAWMARRARTRGLLAGDLVISGGLTAPVDLDRGMLVRAQIDRIGEARFRVV
ncbi:MAG: fumarylacetoacetate hydrolase family protein [Actinomycetota bacterium]|nr:fumarylacetoacetate hydrolase family protein [Actinomycetota bacterium]